MLRLTTSGGYGCDLYEDAAEVERNAWRGSPGDETWGMDLDVLDVQQRALADQARVWFSIVRDAHGEPVASAALALFTTDVVESARNLAPMAMGAEPGGRKVFWFA